MLVYVKNNSSSGQGVIPYRRYSPRTRKGRTGLIPVPTVIVWMEEECGILNLRIAALDICDPGSFYVSQGH